MSPLPACTRRLVRGGAVACALGVAPSIVGAFVDLRHALFSYLVAWMFGFTIAMGALAFMMTAFITHARWLVAMRRIVEAIVVTLPLFAALFVPIAVFAPRIYAWAAPASTLPVAMVQHVERKRAYLNLPFWLARALVFFALWSAVALLLRRWSLRADAHGAPALLAKRRALSGAMAPVFALTFTFAVFDWTMSLDPSWVSNAYGFYLFGGAFLAATAVITISSYAARRAAVIPPEVAASHFHALGNVLLAMTIFWAYIAFVQMMLIWIADLPEEVTWYAVRSRGSWGAVCWLLGIAHFLLPFLALLQRRWKRSPRVLAAIGAWLVLAHYVDVYWLVMPTLYPAGAALHWLDLSALLAVGGGAVAFGAWRFASAPSVPLRDPDVAHSLSFEMT